MKALLHIYPNKVLIFFLHHAENNDIQWLAVVLWSPIQSPFLTPSSLDHNWSSQFQKPPKTRLDYNKLVFCSYKTSFNWFRLQLPNKVSHPDWGLYPRFEQVREELGKMNNKSKYSLASQFARSLHHFWPSERYFWMGHCKLQDVHFPKVTIIANRVWFSNTSAVE